MTILNRKKKTKPTSDSESTWSNSDPFQGYFPGHECHLSRKHLEAYNIKTKSRIYRFVFDLITVRASDIRAINMYRSHAALCAEKFRQFEEYPFTMHPFCKLRLYLELAFLVTMVVLSLTLAIHYAETYVESNDYHDHELMISSFLITVNIIANFFTGYVEGQSHKVAVFGLRKICCKYLKTWLITDLLACTGFYYKLNHPYPHKVIAPQIIMDSFKLLRLPVTVIYMDNILTVMRATIYQKTAAQIVFFLIMYLSWNIFFQFSVEYIIEGSYLPENPRNCSWLLIGKLWNQTTFVRVLFAFDRAVGMLTTNTNMNLLDKRGCFENFLLVYWLISKLLVFHFALKYILALFGQESARANYYIMKMQLETYMVQRNFPPRLKKKILKFYAIRFQSKYFQESRMLQCVSGQLREDILMHTGRQLVRELAFLKQLPSSLLVQLAFKLRVVIYIAGDIIFKINTVGECLYFIDRGTVAIYSDSAKEICHLEDGDFFGEIALVMKNRFRTASAVAVTNCELFRLDREDFETTIAYYPTVYDNIKAVATSRFERTRVLDEQHKAELKTAELSSF